MTSTRKVPPIKISPTEQGKLRGLPFFVRCLYVLAIRPYMDMTNGIVGLVSTISYGSLAADMYVEPHQGEEDSGTPTVSRVKRGVKRLEKAGLIENRSISTITEKRLIFFCPCAVADSSVQNKPGPNSDHSSKKPGPQPGPQKSSNYTASEHEGEPQPGPLFFEHVEKPGSHPESGITTDLSKDKSLSHAPAHGRRLPEDWTLPEDWREWAETERPDLNINLVADTFKDHWLAKPGKDGRKANWNATWRNWVRREKKQRPEINRHEDNRRNHKLSAAERAIEDEREFERRQQAEYCRVYDIAGQRIK